jgi:hypothetical protein
LQVVPHIPALHVGVACMTCVVHIVAHDPQLLRSLVTSVHVDPQSISLPLHPETQEYVLPEPEQSGVAAPHFAPHAPQLLGVLTCVSHPWSDPPSPQ